MSCELEVVDCFGKRVQLEHSNWGKHKARHPEVVDHWDQLATVLSDPDVVIKARVDGAHHFYRRGVAEGRLRNTFLRVIVLYLDEESGVIKTCYFSRSIDTDGEVLILRRVGQRAR